MGLWVLINAPARLLYAPERAIPVIPSRAKHSIRVRLRVRVKVRDGSVCACVCLLSRGRHACASRYAYGWRCHRVLVYAGARVIAFPRTCGHASRGRARLKRFGGGLEIYFHR